MAEQFVVEPRLEDAALGGIEVGGACLEIMQLSDQRRNRLWIVGCDGGLRLLSERVGLRHEVGPEAGLRIIVHVFRRRVGKIGKRAEARDTALVCHIRQIGVALHDIDDVEDIVVAGSPGVRTEPAWRCTYSRVGAAYDRSACIPVQPPNSIGLACISCRMSVMTALTSLVIRAGVVGVDTTENAVRGVVEDGANLRKIGVRRGGRCDASPATSKVPP